MVVVAGRSSVICSAATGVLGSVVVFVVGSVLTEVIADDDHAERSLAHCRAEPVRFPSPPLAR